MACLCLPDHAVENEDAIVASALGIPNYLIQIRTLLHNGEGVSRNLLDAIATAREIPIERLLPFEAVLQLAVQFAYDFVLHAACPLSYSYFAPVCSGTWNYAHRWRTEAYRTWIYHGAKDVVG